MQVLMLTFQTLAKSLVDGSSLASFTLLHTLEVAISTYMYESIL